MICILRFIGLMIISMHLFSTDSLKEDYIVLSGDTLFSIAKSQAVSVSDLKKWNKLDSNKIFEGQKLLLKNPLNKSSKPDNLLLMRKDNLSNSSSRIPEFYKVQKGDSLSSIAKKYNLFTNQLTAWNNLVSTSLDIGQELILREPNYLRLYEVKSNDTLYSIAKDNSTSLESLLLLNGLKEDDLVRVGHKLIILSPSKIQRWHYVKEGDSFESIASLYSLTPEKIKNLNDIKVLSLGSLLRIQTEEDILLSESKNKINNEFKDENFLNQVSVSDSKDSQKTLNHIVQAGDTLYNISLRYKVFIEDIKKANNLSSDTLYKGITLLIPVQSEEKPLSLSGSTISQDINNSQKVLKISDSKLSQKLPETVDLKSNKSTKLNLPSLNSNISHSYSWKSLVVLDPKIPLFEWNGDYYYWEHPKKTYQPSHTYFEYWNSPLDAYYKATTLFQAFDKLVKNRPKKSQSLAGKTIILDPGHGGLDPGAIVKSKDGMNRDIYITEDEYVYDVALRIYVLLKEHGAEVKMTILAPDHLIRDTSPAANTLINMKNEVYNKESLNSDDTKDCWPNGSQEGLARRVDVINNLLGHLDKEKIIFISLHADNQPAMPAHTGIYYQQNPEFNDGYSQTAAEIMQEAMGKDRVYIKGKDLFVLRNNLMKYKLLIELRNVSSIKEAWALRFADMRQKDAEKVVKGILSFFQSSENENA